MENTPQHNAYYGPLLRQDDRQGTPCLPSFLAQLEQLLCARCYCHTSVCSSVLCLFTTKILATDIKALGVSQLLGLGQTMLQLLGKSVLQLYLEDSRKVRERERERKERTHMGDRVPEKALWLLLLYVFSLHLGLPYANWA